MRKLTSWTLRAAFAALATCGFATCQHQVPGPTIAPPRETPPAGPRFDPMPPVGMIEPASVSPKKPPLDAGVDGGGAPLPPLPDGGPVRDAGQPMQARPATP